MQKIVTHEKRTITSIQQVLWMDYYSICQVHNYYRRRSHNQQTAFDRLQRDNITIVVVTFLS